MTRTSNKVVFNKILAFDLLSTC